MLTFSGIGKLRKNLEFSLVSTAINGTRYYNIVRIRTRICLCICQNMIAALHIFYFLNDLHSSGSAVNVPLANLPPVPS